MNNLLKIYEYVNETNKILYVDEHGKNVVHCICLTNSIKIYNNIFETYHN